MKRSRKDESSGGDDEDDKTKRLKSDADQTRKQLQKTVSNVEAKKKVEPNVLGETSHTAHSSNAASISPAVSSQEENKIAIEQAEEQLPSQNENVMSTNTSIILPGTCYSPNIDCVSSTVEIRTENNMAVLEGLQHGSNNDLAVAGAAAEGESQSTSSSHHLFNVEEIQIGDSSEAVNSAAEEQSQEVDSTSTTSSSSSSSSSSGSDNDIEPPDRGVLEEVALRQMMSDPVYERFNAMRQAMNLDNRNMLLTLLDRAERYWNRYRTTSLPQDRYKAED